MTIYYSGYKCGPHVPRFSENGLERGGNVGEHTPKLETFYQTNVRTHIAFSHFDR